MTPLDKSLTPDRTENPTLKFCRIIQTMNQDGIMIGFAFINNTLSVIIKEGAQQTVINSVVYKDPKKTYTSENSAVFDLVSLFAMEILKPMDKYKKYFI